MDITFAEPGSPLIQEVNSSNCQNTTDIDFDLVFTTSGLTAAASTLNPVSRLYLSVAAMTVLGTLSFI